MKKVFVAGITLLAIQWLNVHCFGQEDVIKGKTSLRVFTNFKKGINKNDKSSAFEVRRVYFGYSGNISENFSAEVKLDIGSPEDLSQYSLIRRYAYFKNAGLNYQKGRFAANFGLFDMLQFKTQEQFWGYRYIFKSFQDEYKFGPSADLGVSASYKFCESLKADLVISNGEGYNNLQADDSYNTGIGLTYKNPKGFVFRTYFDFIKKEIISNDISFFAGYQRKNFRLGGEFNKKSNSSFIENHDLTGYSFYGSFVFSEHWEVFERYDIINSNNLSGEAQPWNLSKDGSSILTGLQYKPVGGVLMSLNYQDWVSIARNGSDKAYIYFNIQFEL